MTEAFARNADHLVRLWLRAGSLERAGRADAAAEAWRCLALAARDLLAGGPQTPPVRRARALAEELLEEPGRAVEASARLIEAVAGLDSAGDEDSGRDEARARGAAVRLLLGVLCALVLGGSVLLFSRFYEPRRIAYTRADMDGLAAFLVKAGQGMGSLEQLTANGCSECPCRDRGPVGAMPRGDVCRANWDKALRAAYRAVHGGEPAGPNGQDLIPSAWKRDAWGGPYLLDENAWTLRSAGPDGIPGNADDIVLPLRPQ
ncbi:hypothetical protein [Fundidesulfovibrio agrisoli]|uniref:hypothetical protein n=1 Tax=Fundidesulfovibrio agrisoli TaxID=2922717 RepID=UPI001FADACD1|nr:hypothetical protein [Fundidesulfovibrio agrisoli]